MIILSLAALFLFGTILYVSGFIWLRYGLKKLPQSIQVKTYSISVIVSLHNEEDNISGLLRHLLSQNYAADKHEIILVDDRSEDATYSKLQQYTDDKYPVRIVQITKTPAGVAPKKYAIDQAIQAARGEILLFTDADGRPGPNWIRGVIRYFADSVGMVIGYAPYRTARQKVSFWQKLLAIEYLTHASVAAASTGLGYPATCVGTNMAYRKSVYEELGGFGQFKSIHSGDDDLFLQRVREETQWQVRYASDPDCHVPNAPPVNWLQFYQQRIRYASKGFIYPLELTLLLTGFVLYYLSIPVLLILSVWFPVLFPVVVVGVVCKAVVDYMFISRAAENLHDRRNLYFWPLAFVLHVPYVLFFAFITQFKSYEWAGRRG